MNPKDPKDSKTAAMQTQIGSYRKTEVATSNREALLLMIYSGAIRYLKRAIQATQEKKHAEKLEHIDKTRKIVSELRATLNFEVGGEIARNLERLYDYVNSRLLQGTLDKNTRSLEEALQVLETLHQGWQEATEAMKTEKRVQQK